MSTWALNPSMAVLNPAIRHIEVEDARCLQHFEDVMCGIYLLLGADHFYDELESIITCLIDTSPDVKLNDYTMFVRDFLGKISEMLPEESKLVPLCFVIELHT